MPEWRKAECTFFEVPLWMPSDSHILLFTLDQSATMVHVGVVHHTKMNCATSLTSNGFLLQQKINSFDHELFYNQALTFAMQQWLRHHNTRMIPESNIPLCPNKLIDDNLISSPSQNPSAPQMFFIIPAASFLIIPKDFLEEASHLNASILMHLHQHLKLILPLAPLAEHFPMFTPSIHMLAFTVLTSNLATT
jgi:hypothetical protein